MTWPVTENGAIWMESVYNTRRAEHAQDSQQPRWAGDMDHRWPLGQDRVLITGLMRNFLLSHGVIFILIDNFISSNE